MKKQKIIIDVPSINKTIHNIHHKFIKNHASNIEKVIADHSLLSNVVCARISKVLECFKLEKIIDNISVIDQNPLKKICVRKNGFDNSVDIITNGTTIILCGTGYSLGLGDVFAKIRFDNVQNEDFDWTNFAKELVDYIHCIIYNKSEVIETSINNLLADNTKE
jgi:hypothetical protein